MMEFCLHCWDGSQHTLPFALDWELNYGLGSPCDSFQVTIPWSGGQEEILDKGTRMVAKWQGETVFTGVVDEWEASWSREGSLARVSGRGMQALLLDNQAEAVDYGAATLQDILQSHVYPYGIQLAEEVSLPPVAGFSIASGSSRWQVVYQFARYYGGVTPRFDRLGRLVLAPWGTGKKKLDGSIPMTQLVRRHKRYGVLSQVLVRDNVRLTSQTVVDQAFIDQGGCASRVMLMPRDTSYQSMRYNGQFQLKRSQAERDRVELTAALPFLAWPGELIQLDQPAWSANGTYRVLETGVTMGSEGYETRLVLGDPDGVL